MPASDPHRPRRNPTLDGQACLRCEFQFETDDGAGPTATYQALHALRASSGVALVVDDVAAGAAARRLARLGYRRARRWPACSSSRSQARSAAGTRFSC